MSGEKDQQDKFLGQVAEQREQFAAAFLESTGLRPEDAQMKYGKTAHQGGNMVMRLWFERREETEELEALRAFVAEVAAGKNPEQHRSAAFNLSMLFGHKSQPKLVQEVSFADRLKL